MGRFVNPDNSAFQVALNSKIHIDVQWLKKIGWLNTNDTELNRARQDVEALKQLKTEIENLIKNIKNKPNGLDTKMIILKTMIY